MRGMSVVYVIAVLIAIIIYLSLHYVALKAQLSTLDNEYNMLENNYTMLRSQYDNLVANYTGIVKGMYQPYYTNYPLNPLPPLPPGWYEPILSFYVPSNCSVIVTLNITSSSSPINVYVVNASNTLRWTVSMVILIYTNDLLQYGYINSTAYSELMNGTLQQMLMSNPRYYVSLRNNSLYEWRDVYNLSQTITVSSIQTQPFISWYMVFVKNAGSQETYITAQITSYKVVCSS